MVTKPQPRPVTLFACDNCSATWSTCLPEDADIVCPRCKRRDTWVVRSQLCNPWHPWPDQEAYYNARAERIP
jgi:hypothetical protein